MNSYFYKTLFLLGFLVVGSHAIQATNAAAKKPNATYPSENIGTSVFTGQISYTIPLYTVNDPDFPLEIALCYQSDGFKPFHPSGFYGQDWSLIAGGCISRIVQGFPDEQKIDYRNHMGNNVEALIGMHQSFIEECMPDKNSVFQMSPSVYSNECGVACAFDDIGLCWWTVDYMPDIFHFDFMGYHGRFMINNQNKPVIISGDFVDIDISYLSELHIPCFYESTGYSPETYSKISITTDDGYKYVFGGSLASLEYATLTKRKESLSYQNVPEIIKWYLTEIVAPNGRVMQFQYKSGNGLKFFTTDYDWSKSSDTTHITYLWQKSCLLQSITTSDDTALIISFYASEEDHKMYEDTAFTMCLANLQLDSINVRYGSRILQTANLSYTYRKYSPIAGTNTNYYWRYLSSVRISGVGTYTLNYNIIDPHPSTAPPFVHDYIYPNLRVTTDEAYKAIADRFGYWKMTSLQGLLSSISLPTGGRIRFTYGNHQYGEERRFRKLSNQNIELYALNTSDHTIGGARVEMIETLSDDNTIAETKTYVYDKPGTTNSSGVFYNIYELYDSFNEPKTIANPSNYGMIYSHIGYSYVQRITTINGRTYKTIYVYDTGHNAYNTTNDPTINRNTNVQDYSDSIELYSGSLTYCPHLVQTGKLLAIEQYIGNTIQKATYFRYNGIANTAVNLPAFTEPVLGCTDTIVCMSYYSGHIARKLFVYPDVLEQTVIYEYGNNSNNQPMISSSTYTYDARFRKKRVTFTDSRGRINFTNYTYPDELSADNLSPLGLLKQSHRINIPIETVSGYIEGGNEYVTAGSINLYANGEYGVIVDTMPSLNGDTMYIGEMRYYPYLYQTLTLPLSAPIGDYMPMWVSNNGIVYDSHYQLNTEYFSDKMGRLLSVKPFGGIETKYTWNGIYPVTKTIGNQTWTYTYIPHVGISSVTDPRGITTYYTYDSAGRLIEEYQIVNGNKQVLSAYQYHIKTE